MIGILWLILTFAALYYQWWFLASFLIIVGFIGLIIYGALS